MAAEGSWRKSAQPQALGPARSAGAAEQVPGLAAAHDARLCAECLELCHETLTERLA